MTQHHDLPLFRWTPPIVEIIPFPVSKRVGHIRRVAARLKSSRTQREADAGWKQAVDSIGRQMERVGISADRINDELRSFHVGVIGELRRLESRSVSPDGETA